MLLKALWLFFTFQFLNIFLESSGVIVDEKKVRAAKLWVTGGVHILWKSDENWWQVVRGWGPFIFVLTCLCTDTRICCGKDSGGQWQHGMPFSVPFCQCNIVCPLWLKEKTDAQDLFDRVPSSLIFFYIKF